MLGDTLTVVALIVLVVLQYVQFWLLLSKTKQLSFCYEHC